MKTLTLLLLFVTSLCIAQSKPAKTTKPAPKADSTIAFKSDPSGIADVTIGPNGDFLYPKAFTDSMKIVRLEYHLRETLKLVNLITQKKESIQAAYEVIQNDYKDKNAALQQQLQQRPK